MNTDKTPIMSIKQDFQEMKAKNATPRTDAEYVCAQCGPDKNGSRVHAMTHHQWPPVDEDTALLIEHLRNEQDRLERENAALRKAAAECADACLEQIGLLYNGCADEAVFNAATIRASKARDAVRELTKGMSND